MLFHFLRFAYHDCAAVSAFRIMIAVRDCSFLCRQCYPIEVMAGRPAVLRFLLAGVGPT